MTTALVPIRKSGATQVSLMDLAEQVARKQIADIRVTVSSRKARVSDAKKKFAADPLETLSEIQDRARALFDVFDASIIEETLPLNQAQINTLSAEFFELEQLRIKIEALADRYKTLVYGHLDQTGPKVEGRPASQVPGKVEAEGPEPHYIFERRGGNRDNPDLDAAGMREALPAHLAEMIYKTVHHPAVEEWDEDVFDQDEFVRLVDAGLIDLDVVARFLTPGKWRTPSFYKTLVDGEQ